MLKLFGQLRRQLRRPRRRNPYSYGDGDVSRHVDTETASYSNNNTQHDIIDDLRLACSSSSRKRKRKQSSCSSGGENDRDDDDVSRSCGGGAEVRRVYGEVDLVDEEGGDVSRIDGGVDHDLSRVDRVDEEGGDFGRSCRGVDEGLGGDVNGENADDDVIRGVDHVDEGEGDVSRAHREVDYVVEGRDDVSRSYIEVDHVDDSIEGEEGDDVSRVNMEVEFVDYGGDDDSRFDVEVDDVEGLIDEVIVNETTSFCSGENCDNKEGKGLEVRKNRMEVPPDDDCCPICFGSFVVPCRGPCGHWYCGGCILQYWNYTAALQPCSCPMCSQKITILTPEASLSQKQDAAVTEVLRNVRKYNRLFLGGPYGMILKMLELPLYIKRVFTEMMNPDRPGAHLNKIRIFAMTLGFFYSISPFDFLRIGRHNVLDLFDYSAIFLSLVLYGVGIYRRRRRFRNVRELAAIQL